MSPTKNTCKNVRTDFILIANDQEIGCGEIKPPGATSQSIEEDRARTSESMKRQLHTRILKSKDTKEFMTFGLVFSGLDIELYVMVFDTEKSPVYNLYEVENVKLPTTLEHYMNIEETLEYLLSFKVVYSISTNYIQMECMIDFNYFIIFFFLETNHFKLG